MAREPALLLELGISASMGQTTSLAIGAWAVRPLRALPELMLAPRVEAAAVGLVDRERRQVIHRTPAMRVARNDHAEGLALHRLAVAFIGDQHLLAGKAGIDLAD